MSTGQSTADGKQEENRLRPNTFQTPNLIVDRLMALLDDSELRIIFFVLRHRGATTDALKAGVCGSSFGPSEHELEAALGALQQLRIVEQKEGQWFLTYSPDWQAIEKRGRAKP